ncbi:MAG: family 43 glycosylhydrolase [Bacteroidetes bacterium]|nr:family 43 glycosylhydrolase [Bacteroidota bacterium]
MVYHAHYSKHSVHPRRVLIQKVDFEKRKKAKAPVLVIDTSRIVPLTHAYFSNPIFDGADPWVLQKDSFYYWCANTHQGIEISKSRLLTQKGESKKVWSSPDTGWNRKNIWAPELHYIHGKYYIYYAAGYEGPPFTWQKSGVLESRTDDPQGEYTDLGMLQTGDDPTNPQTNVWAIDVTILQHKNKLYAVWSGWDKPATTDKTSQQLYIAPLSNPYTISGPRVLLSRPEESWETGGPLDLNEGPEILKNDSNIFIVYSCRESWLKEYRLGQLRLVHPDSSVLVQANWIKSGPVFQGTDQVLGTGHASFTLSPDKKENWIIYHAKKSETPGWERDVRAQPFSWKPDGSPDFGTPLPAGVPMKRPSGEQPIMKKIYKVEPLNTP